jgi:hemoglobin-like flavoprotein
MAEPKVGSARRHGARTKEFTMSPQQIQIVRSTFTLVAPGAAYVAATFYRRLFELEPALRPMFRDDLEGQGRKLVQAIGTVVGALDRFETVRPTLRDLGRRHALYGVRDRHYDTVGVALLWTLAQGFGDAFTPEVRDAWTAAYGQVAAEMKAGAVAWKQSPLARHVDESLSALSTGDSVALHRWARRERSRMIGDVIARAWTALAGWTGRLLDAFVSSTTKRSRRINVI